MKPALVTIAALAMLVATPVTAADTLAWPWKSKTPPDPALAMLSKITDLTATVDKSIVSIVVKVDAPTPNYSELQLTPRMGDPNDRIFAFDARGRAPQDLNNQVITPVTIKASYSAAPIGKFDVIEIYAKENCMGYSVKDGKPVECSSNAPPQP